jgi:serine/threonine protein phosphatase PrpC
MEDEHVAARPLLSQDGENVNLFGVFDGHGGQHCSKYLHQNLAPVVCKSVERTWHSGSTEDAIKAAFRDVDSAFLASIGNEDVGSTAVVVLLKGRTLYCANTGDSRAILCRADGTTMLSCDHKPNRSLPLSPSPPFLPFSPLRPSLPLVALCGTHGGLDRRQRRERAVSPCHNCPQPKCRETIP